MTRREIARVFVPGSVGNVGPGLDILGLALDGAGDEVTLRWSDTPGITITEAGHPSLPRDPMLHTSAIAAAAVLRRAEISRGISLSLQKGLPLSGGQGGSAASAVAGAVAANHLAGANLSSNELLECALEGEAIISGHHADNLAPSLLGGLVLVQSVAPMDVIQLPVPANLLVVIVRPEQELLTREARRVLPTVISRDLALRQAAHVAAMVAGAFLGDVARFGRAIDDQIAEPARAPLLPGFTQAKAAAIAAGAFGCSISGSGPTVFAITDDAGTGEKILTAMIDGYQRTGISASGRVASVDRRGARILT